MADLGQVLGDTGRRLANDLRVATIGRAAKFVRSTGRAGVTRLMRFVTSDGQEQTYPDSPSAVVMTPRGDGYGVHFDVASGDLGVLVASDDGWEQSWQTGLPSRGSVGGRHEYGNAAFFPGGRKGGTAAINGHGEMTIGAEDGSAGVVFSRVRAAPLSLGKTTIQAAGAVASILLGASASRAVAFNDEVKPILQLVLSWWSAQVTFWAAQVPATPAEIAYQSFVATTLPPLITSLTALLAAMNGTIKVRAE